jgi:hypothetical protein
MAYAGEDESSMEAGTIAHRSARGDTLLCAKANRFARLLDAIYFPNPTVRFAIGQCGRLCF